MINISSRVNAEARAETVTTASAMIQAPDGSAARTCGHFKPLPRALVLPVAPDVNQGPADQVSVELI